MKRYLGLIVLIASFVGITVYLVSSQSGRADKAEKDLAWTRLQRDYLERVAWIRSNPDAKTYSDEVRSFFGWYFKQVDDFNTRYHGDREFDDYLVDLQKRNGSEKDVKARKAVYEYVRKRFDAMRAGQYAPVFSATDKGMRFDLLTNDVRSEGMKRKIHWEFGLWGAQRNLIEDGKTKKMVTSAGFQVSMKLIRKNKKEAPHQMNIEGVQGQKVDYPERFLAAFPAQMVIGHYDIDPVPSDVEKAEITFTVTSRSQTGGEAVATYAWNLDVPEDWKLKPGETWEGATVQEQAADEPM